MLVKVKMPKIGLTTEQVEVTAWLKNVGDTIEHDEILVTVEADKAAYEVPAPSRGKLIEIHAEAGSTINVGDLIAVIQA